MSRLFCQSTIYMNQRKVQFMSRLFRQSTIYMNQRKVSCRSGNLIIIAQENFFLTEYILKLSHIIQLVIMEDTIH